MRLYELKVDVFQKIYLYVTKSMTMPANIMSKISYSFLKKLTDQINDPDKIEKIQQFEPNWLSDFSRSDVNFWFSEIYKEFGNDVLHSLFEQIDRYVLNDTGDFEEVLSEIEKNCSKILKIYKKVDRFIFRGINSTNPYIKSTINKNRTPTSLRIDQQEIFDAALKRRGFTAVRGNSIFTTPRFSIANQWGTGVYIVFPTNDFKYTWFKNLTSIYVYDYISYKNTEEDIERVVEQLEPTNKNLIEAIRSQQEILITGSGYYGIQEEYWEKVKNWISTLQGI